MSDRKRILVTGGAGYIGQRLLPVLMKEADVVSLDLKPADGVTESIVGSVTDRRTVDKAMAGADAVLHMAYGHPDHDLGKQADVNIKGTTYVLEACVELKVPRIVFASTVMTVWAKPEYPDRPAYHNFSPVNFYSYSKCCQELLIEMYTGQHDFLSGICLRIGQPERTPKNPTRFGPNFGMERDAEVLVPFDDLCEAFRLAILDAEDVKFASLFLTGDYGNNHYFVDETRKALGLRFRWKVERDPEAEGVYILRKVGSPDACQDKS
jgi:nucleoside-diphosphate-sugar epimerase